MAKVQMIRYEPETPRELELETRAFNALEELGTQRRLLRNALRRPLPSILWVILIGGAVAVLGVMLVSSIDVRI